MRIYFSGHNDRSVAEVLLDKPNIMISFWHVSRDGDFRGRALARLQAHHDKTFRWYPQPGDTLHAHPPSHHKA